MGLCMKMKTQLRTFCVLVALQLGAAQVCQPGWTYNSKTFKCYKFVEKAGDWADAHNNCHALADMAAKNIGPIPPVRVGLVSIRDAEENIFVGRDIAKGRYILTGGNRLVDGTWIWTDGSKWDFTNWNAVSLTTGKETAKFART